MGMVHAPVRKRTIWIWLIALFYALVLSFAAWPIVSGAVPLMGTGTSEVAGPTTFYILLTFATGVCNAVGAAALFFLRRWAVPLFSAGLALSVVRLAWNGFTEGWGTVIGVPRVGLAIAWVFMIAVLAYAWRLGKRGRLA